MNIGPILNFVGTLFSCFDKITHIVSKGHILSRMTVVVPFIYYPLINAEKFFSNMKKPAIVDLEYKKIR